MFLEADDKLFRKILYNKAHILRTYLPDRREIVYSLHTKTHNKSRICKTSHLNKRHFLLRSQYKVCYWFFYHSAVLYTFVYFLSTRSLHFLRPISLICYHSCVCQLVLVKKLDDDDDVVHILLLLQKNKYVSPVVKKIMNYYHSNLYLHNSVFSHSPKNTIMHVYNILIHCTTSHRSANGSTTHLRLPVFWFCKVVLK